MRQTLFPKNKLRPKHHYISHYAGLIFEYGPLIKVWTLRFEQKLTFFKRVIRYIKNFINVTKSVTEKHELLQSLVRLGVDRRCDLQYGDTTDFQIHLYNNGIQRAVKTANLKGKIQECKKINFKGT